MSYLVGEKAVASATTSELAPLQSLSSRSFTHRFNADSPRSDRLIWMQRCGIQYRA